MSTADSGRTDSFPAEWKRLEQAASEASDLLARWVGRARAAEAEVERLRKSLEELEAGGTERETAAEELRRLKAENAALHSRMLQARKRLVALMQRLAALEIEP